MESKRGERGGADKKVDLEELKKRAAAVGLNPTILIPLSPEQMQEMAEHYPHPPNTPPRVKTNGFVGFEPLVKGSKLLNQNPSLRALFEYKGQSGAVVENAD